jgi:hypothetical protein
MKELPTQPTNIIKDEDELLSAESPQAKLLCWHYQLGDLPFTCLQILALIGRIPKWLLTVKAQKCAGCMYGAMTKQPWRMKRIQNKNKIQVATSPSDCVSMHGPAGISDTRIHSTTQRETYQKEIRRCHHLCPPCKPSQLQILPTANFL